MTTYYVNAVLCLELLINQQYGSLEGQSAQILHLQ